MSEVQPAGDGGDVVPAGELRASYDDRDRVAEVLRIAAGDGRLSADELDQRLEAALTARTYGELAALTRDLPAVRGAAAAPRELAVIDCRSASVRRDGSWVVPRRLEIRVSSGSVTLDFTEAVLSQPSLDIDAEVGSGTLTLVTRPGITVDTGDVALRSGTVRDRTRWSSAAPPVLHIQLSGRVGSGSIAVRPPRPPRRTFWAWLLRRPRPRPRYPVA
jgi:DUF1707 SHOCT-like domain